MTKFAKCDLVRVLATKFDDDDENVDELGLKYSERQLRDGKGAWCYGKIHEVAVCRKNNCWQLHLGEVERNARDEFGI